MHCFKSFRVGVRFKLPQVIGRLRKGSWGIVTLRCLWTKSSRRFNILSKATTKAFNNKKTSPGLDAVLVSAREILTVGILGHVFGICDRVYVIYISVYLAFDICGMYLSNAIPRSAVPASVGEILTVGHLQSAKWSRQSRAAHSSLWSNTYFAQVLLAQLDWPSSDRWLFVISEKYNIVNSFVLYFCSTCISILNPDITQGDLHNWTVDQTRLSDFVLLVISGW